MKTLIAYATRHGAAKCIAEKIAGELGDVVLCDLREASSAFITEYDCVVIGGSLYAGRVCREAQAFAAEREVELLQKTVGLFVSGLADADAEKYFSTNFPAALVESAKAKAFLGGIYDPEKCGFWERFVLRLLGKRAYVNTVSDEKIAAFAKQLNG